MKIPEKLKIAGHWVKVNKDYKFEERTDLHAQSITSSNIINIESDYSYMEGMSDSQCSMTFLGCILEHVLERYCRGQLLKTEEVKAVTEGLYQVLVDNNLDLSATNFPKRVIIAGHSVDVIENYKFRETTDVTGLAAYCVGMIRVGGNSFLGKNPTESHKVVVFIHEILHHVCHRYNGGEQFPEGVINGLSEGIYQVFKDNNLKFD